MISVRCFPVVPIELALDTGLNVIGEQMEKVNPCNFLYFIDTFSVCLQLLFACNVLALETNACVTVFICKQHLVEAVGDEYPVVANVS